MTRTPILVPDLMTPSVVLSVWYVKPGEKVRAGDRVVELLLGSATFDVTATASGVLVQQCAGPDEVLTVDQILGFIEVAK